MDKRVAILDVLRGRSPASRAELAELSGLSPATVSRAVQRLRREGFVRDVAGTSAGLGRPARLVELRPDAAFVVGIDAGGSMLRAVLADLEGVMRGRAARPARDPRDGVATVADLAATARDVIARAADRPILAVAAGISGIVDHASGRVLLSPDLPGLNEVAVAGLLEKELGIPVVIDNDDLLAAVGEGAAGSAAGCSNIAFLSLGYGLGAGLIVDGRPVRGASRAAGAIAYLAPGRLEARASGRAIPILFRAALGRAGGPGHAGEATDPGADARTVFELAAAGDPVAASVVGEVVEALGDLVVNVAALLDPEVIVLGGGLAANGPVLFEPLSRRLAGAVPYPPRLVPSALESAAVVHGAVAVALDLARRRLAGPQLGAPSSTSR